MATVREERPLTATISLMQANRRSKSAVALETRDAKRPNEQIDPGEREEGVEGEDEFVSVGSAHSRAHAYSERPLFIARLVRSPIFLLLPALLVLQSLA